MLCQQSRNLILANLLYFSACNFERVGYRCRLDLHLHSSVSPDIRPPVLLASLRLCILPLRLLFHDAYVQHFTLFMTRRDALGAVNLALPVAKASKPPQRDYNCSGFGLLQMNLLLVKCLTLANESLQAIVPFGD